MILECFEQVVSTESERYIDKLSEEIIEKIDLHFDFNPSSDSKLPFQNLEKVYSYPELDTFFDQLMANCDQELSLRLKGILTVKNLVIVRNDFEDRICRYFDNNVRDVNKLQSRKFCHNLLDEIYTHHTFKLQDLIKVKSVQNLKQESVSSMIQIFN